MANVKGIGGLNTSSGTNKLIAAYGNDLIDVDTGNGYGLNLSSSNDVVFESFLDSLFFQNYNHTPLTFDGSSWTNLHVKQTPKAKYIKEWNEQMYIAYVDINSTTYASRVMYSDFPGTDKYGDLTIQWGFMSGTNGSVTANTNRFRAANAGFKTYDIEVGDTLTIESGDNAGEYTVSAVSSDQMITVNETFSDTQSSITYWVGSNWFDVKTNNSDVITGLSENSSNLLVFKKDTLHRYNRSSLRTVRGPGTSSHKSIVYFPDADVNIYFHGSTDTRTGFYLYDGTRSINISRAVQPFVDGISSSNYDDVVAWAEGNTYRAYVGDLSNDNSSNEAFNISDTNAVFSYSISDNKWSIDPISDAIKARGYFRESGYKKVLLGNDSGEVFLTPSGYDFDGDPIKFAYETKVIYPSGPEIVSRFNRFKVVSRDAGRVKVLYKLWGKPFDVDQRWRGVGNLMRDTMEFDLSPDHNTAAGIQFRFEEYGTKEPVPTIERIGVYHKPYIIDTPEKRRL